MSRTPAPLPLAAFACALVMGCSSTEAILPTDAVSEPAAAAAAAAAAQPAASLSTAAKTPHFDPRDFVRVIDNPFFPLSPGTHFVYEGLKDGEPSRNVFEVTHDVKTILGVRAVVVLDRLYQRGALVEKTFDYFAQDEDGNVWYLGEDTKEFANGQVVSTDGTWLAGKDGARAGVFMPRHPKVGETTQQEFAPGVAEDMSTFLRLDASVTAPYGTFRNCLKTEDFTPLEPGAKEVKFYCRGIGFVKGRDLPDGATRLALIDIR